jgi:hypothetical protein
VSGKWDVYPDSNPLDDIRAAAKLYGPRDLVSERGQRLASILGMMPNPPSDDRHARQQIAKLTQQSGFAPAEVAEVMRAVGDNADAALRILEAATSLSVSPGAVLAGLAPSMLAPPIDGESVFAGQPFISPRFNRSPVPKQPQGLSSAQRTQARRAITRADAEFQDVAEVPFEPAPVCVGGIVVGSIWRDPMASGADGLVTVTARLPDGRVRYAWHERGTVEERSAEDFLSAFELVEPSDLFDPMVPPIIVGDRWAHRSDGRQAVILSRDRRAGLVKFQWMNSGTTGSLPLPEFLQYFRQPLSM